MRCAGMSMWDVLVLEALEESVKTNLSHISMDNHCGRVSNQMIGSTLQQKSAADVSSHLAWHKKRCTSADLKHCCFFLKGIQSELNYNI